MTKQTITRKGAFDSAHRVMNEMMKCYNVHGHTYLYELTFEFTTSEEIGYNIDFKEIKRIGCQWIDDILDHGVICNPHDTILINASKELNSKVWLMSLNGKDQYCNPSVENIAKEVFIAMSMLFNERDGLSVSHLRIYETPNCYTDCTRESITNAEYMNFADARRNEIEAYRDAKGVVEYDDRKV